jgi:hypothetical protein
MSVTFTFIAPVPDLQITARSGNNYTADANGIITGVVPGDFLDLAQAGCKIGGNLTDRLPLLNARNTTGAALGASATSGAMGYSITLGTSAALVGEATSSSAKTDVCLFEYILPSSYVAGTNPQLVVNTNYTGSGTVTAVSTTMTPTVYAEVDAGTQGANICSTAQQIGSSAADLTFTLTGTGLTAGQRLMLELSMLVTTSAGAATGQVNSIRVVLP